MKITWFGHSTFRIETGKSVVLIDPFLTGNPTFEKSGVSWDDATKGTTHVVISHGHDDHVGDAAKISKTYGAPVFANYEIALAVGAKGAEKLEPMNTGGTVTKDDVSVSLVNALHSSSTQVDGVFRYLGNPNGIILRVAGAKTIYHMGDTDMFAGMSLIEEFYKPEIGLVPVGDRFTMGAKNAAFACKKFFKFNTIIPCHYGTFPGYLDLTADAFVAEMKGHNVVVPKAGSPVAV